MWSGVASRFDPATYPLKEPARAGWWMSTQILVKEPRIMVRQRLSIIVRDDHTVGIVPGERRLGTVAFVHGLAM